MLRPEKDLVILWKSVNVYLESNKYMFIIYYYRTDRANKENNFYKCNIRIDTKENWLKLKDDLIKTNPAEHFRTSMIDMEDDYHLFYSNRVFNRMDMSKWMGSRFLPKKIISLDEFLKSEEDKKEPYLKKYIINDKEIYITDYNNIPNGQWFSSIREPKKRKPYGRIIY